MKYCLIFYSYFTLATKDYTRHHRVGYSLDVDDDFSKIAVIFRLLRLNADDFIHHIPMKSAQIFYHIQYNKFHVTIISANPKIA